MREIIEWIVLGLLGICAVHDGRKREIPIVFLILISIVVAVSALCFGRQRVWDILGGMLIGGICFVISKCTKEAIGYGDSWLVLALGIYLGGFRLLQMMFVASMAAGIFSLFYLWRHGWKTKAAIPFVPFMTVAYLGVMFV